MIKPDSLSMKKKNNNRLNRASLSLVGSVLLMGLGSSANAIGPVAVPET